MTNITEIKACRADEQLDKAIAMFNEGFNSKAAKQRCLEALNNSYNYTRDIHFDEVCASAPGQDAAVEEFTDELNAARAAHFDRLEVPFDLHQVRDRHADAFGTRWDRIQELRNMREQARAAEVVPPAKGDAPLKELEARVTESLEQLMARRKEQFIRGCELHDIFGGLPVSVNAHWVVNQFGTGFIRRFYYMDGKLTPLNMILAIMDTKAREKEEG